MSDSLQPHGLYSPWNSPGQNTGVGSCSLLQGIFPTQGSNPGLPDWRWIFFFYQLSHQGSLRILEWVTYPFSRESSPPRNRTWVSSIAGGFFTSAPYSTKYCVCIHLVSMEWFIHMTCLHSQYSGVGHSHIKSFIFEMNTFIWNCTLFT